MQYRRLRRTGLVVPEACMGTMTFGGVTDEAEAERMFARRLDRTSRLPLTYPAGIAIAMERRRQAHREQLARGRS